MAHYETFGSATGNGIPAYASSKAPFGEWIYGSDGITQYKVPDKTSVIPIGHSNDRGYGDYELPDGRDVWIEISHVRLVQDEEPTPEPTPTAKKYKISFLGLTVNVTVEELV